MAKDNSEAFINDVSATMTALRDLSVGIARYVTENEASLDESQRNDLKESVGALTIQIAALQGCLISNDLDSASKTELLASAKSSVEQATLFLTAATSKD